MIEDLFVNICIVTTFVLIYMKTRWGRRETSNRPWVSNLIDGLCGGVLGLVLMHFSINVTSETLADLRYIPILLMILFIGKKPTYITTIFIILSRFLFGINKSSYSAAVAFSLMLIGYLIINHLFEKEDNLLIRGAYMVLLSNILTTGLFYFLIKDMNVLLHLIGVYWIVSTIGGVTSILLVNYLRTSEYLFRKYKNESTTDFLTGLKNVRNFDSVWAYSKQLSAKNGKALSLIMLDIDHFKRINDTYGHGTGDFVLMEISRIMEDVVGNRGSVFRKGGEEFAIVLPTFTKSQAAGISERIRGRVERHQFLINDELKLSITISIGFVSYPESVSETEGMLDKADEALYKAKENGRNQVVSW
ncbi:diguanylate cyclase [Marinilactibacillus piezotolerans]|uniref:diguanylate cyclase n=1 Tax=Marinilactibacillus piezotolerans TaxID=258723 RepID=UPI0009B0420F|nr:diguanylate cyclase [Marinilactibacillus piezotolerans]